MMSAYFRVRTRLTVGFAVLLSAMVAITTVAISDMQHIQRNLDVVARSDMTKIALVNQMRDAVRFQAIALRDIVMQEDLAFKKQELKLLKAAREQYQAAAQSIIEKANGTNLAGDVSALADVELNVKNEIAATVEFSLNDQHVEAGDAIREKVRPAQMALLEKLDSILKNVEAQAAESAAAATTTYKNALKSLTIAATVSVIVGVLTAVVITRSIVSPLRRAVAAANCVANGDLTQRIEVSGQDETAELSSALRNMQDGIANIIRGVKDNAEAVAATARVVAESTHAFSSRVGDMNIQITSVSAAVEETSAIIANIARDADGVTRASGHTQEIVKNNDQAVEQTVAIAGQTAQAMRNASDAMELLERSIVRIAEFTNVIGTIANQTNLLALNASIEAARAGENGRGFAVVADEVRLLSQKTASSIADISQIVSTVGDRTKDAVRAIDQVKTKVDATAEQTAATGAAIHQILDASTTVSELIAGIVLATKEQATATGDAAKSMGTLSQLAEENQVSFTRIDEYAGDLNGTAEKLSALVAQFKVSA